MDLYGIGSTMNSLSNLITGSLNYKEQKKAREENMAFQKEQFNYLKEQNKLQQHREDTAVQRKMADLNRSGLNPLAADATGGASTGATGSTTSFTGEQAAQRSLDMLSGLQIEADSLYNLMSAKNGLAQQQAQTDNLNQDLLNKQQEILESQGRIANTTEDTNLKKKQQEEIGKQMNKIDAEISNINANTTNTQSKTDTENWNRQYSQNYNLRTTDALGKISAGPLSIDMNLANTFNKAVTDMTNSISNTISDKIEKGKKWAKSKYNQMRGKAN